MKTDHSLCDQTAQFSTLLVDRLQIPYWQENQEGKNAEKVSKTDFHLQNKVRIPSSK